MTITFNVSTFPENSPSSQLLILITLNPTIVYKFKLWLVIHFHTHIMFQNVGCLTVVSELLIHLVNLDSDVEDPESEVLKFLLSPPKVILVTLLRNLNVPPKIRMYIGLYGHSRLDFICNMHYFSFYFIIMVLNMSIHNIYNWLMTIDVGIRWCANLCFS